MLRRVTHGRTAARVTVSVYSVLYFYLQQNYHIYISAHARPPFDV